MADERWKVPSYLREGSAPSVSDEIANLPRATLGKPSAGAAVPAPRAGDQGGTTVAPEAVVSRPPVAVDPNRPTREEYGEMPMLDVAGRALSNAPSSAWNAIKGVGEAIYNYDQTGEALGQLGKGLYSKASGALGYERNPEAEALVDAIGSMYADRYGSMAAFKETLGEDPFAIGLDVASVAPVIGAAGKASGLGKLATGAGRVAALGDPVNLALEAGKLGTKAVTRPAAAVARYPQAIATGAPPNALALANEIGRSADPMARNTFFSAMRGSSEPRDIARAAVSAMGEKKQAASDFYTSRKAELTTLPLPMTEIRAALDDAMMAANQYGTRFGTPVVDALQAMDAKIRALEAHPNPGARTAVQLDLLKRDLRDIVEQIPPSDRGAIAGVPRSVRDTIAKVDEKYADMMDYWQEWMSTMRDLQSTLGTGDRVSETSRLAKLMSTMKSGDKLNLLKQLEDTPSGKYLKEMIAGTAFRDIMPAYLQGFGLGAAGSILAGGPHGIAAAAAASPRLAGLTQYGIGRLEGAVNRIPRPPAVVTNALYQLEQDRAHGGRVERKAGGRVGVGHDRLADQLVGAAERAKKGINKDTETLLDMPDDHIAHALEVANRSI